MAELGPRAAAAKARAAARKVHIADDPPIAHAFDESEVETIMLGEEEFEMLCSFPAFYQTFASSPTGDGTVSVKLGLPCTGLQAAMDLNQTHGEVLHFIAFRRVWDESGV